SDATAHLAVTVEVEAVLLLILASATGEHPAPLGTGAEVRLRDFLDYERLLDALAVLEYVDLVSREGTEREKLAACDLVLAHGGLPPLGPLLGALSGLVLPATRILG